ncbi:lysosome membrane protein 2-like [Sitophilus oryzae]|uniref:Lysosome membrane protein 2-like n=1 Tax=Sitophilus oryzae TaxID=7048 RepID=A0A6J2XQR7_SITOR|nr:lysosome membrane protein 2-like [Sitophilus oryzae]
MRHTMGLYKQYFRLTQRARNHLLGISNQSDGTNHHLPLQMLISQHFSHGRLSVIILGLFTLAIGIILSSIPWLDYIIVKNLKLREGSFSFHYWQKPGVIRLTKVYIFNVSNPDGFLRQGEKPKLQEIGPFVYKLHNRRTNWDDYRSKIENKVNIKVSLKTTNEIDEAVATLVSVLQEAAQLSTPLPKTQSSVFHIIRLGFEKDSTIQQIHRITSSITQTLEDKKYCKSVFLNTLSTQSNNMGYWLQKTISVLLAMGSSKPFVSVTADELVFGYDDSLVSLAHKFYPKRKKPSNKMGLLISRNGTLAEVHNMYTGETGMQEFGLLANLNGKETLPYWDEAPCNDLTASEGSFFPPRYFTKRDVVYLYDKDLCRTFPFQYRESGEKHDVLRRWVKSGNKCFCPGNEYCPPKGLQNISPCQYDAPVYLSFPHFLDADPSLINEVEGLNPVRQKHQSYFRIQPKLGVPVEGKVRVQLNLRIQQAPNINPVKDFKTMVFPVMWLEEGIDELTPPIRRWLYVATTFADVACPLMTYGFIIFGSCLIIAVFVNAYKSIMFTKKTIQIGMKNLRRGSLLISSNR